MKQSRQRAIALGLVLGLAFGLATAASGSTRALAVASALEPIGTIFLNLVRMVVIPLVVATVFTGVVRLADPRHLGKLGAMTLAFFWSTTLIAIVLGMVVMKLVLPLAPPTVAPAVAARALDKLPTLTDFLVGLVPVNPVAAAAQGSLLPLIVFTVCFGAAASALARDSREQLVVLAESVTDAMVQLVQWVLWTAPVGVFALAAALTARSGWSMLQNLAVFIGGVLAALVLFVAVVYVPAVRYLGGVAPMRFLRACVSPAAMALSTTSSAASLPALFESASELGLSPNVSGFVLSLGSAINRTGSALFQGAAVIFLAAIYHVPIAPAALVGATLAIFLVAQSVAGVPSAGVVALAPVLSSLGIPLDGLAILLGVDRIPDMARTATQVTGHLAAATVVERFAPVREDR
jgi:Na+/H+-dicarboxylate symporter